MHRLTPTAPVLLALLLAAPAAAAPPKAATSLTSSPAFALSPAELLQQQVQDAPENLDVEVLLFDVDYSFDTQKRRTMRQRLVYRVLTQRGVEGWASTGASYQPWYQDKPTIRARVITPDGAEHKLHEATLVDSAASEQNNAIYSDRRRIRGPLPALRPGAVVEEFIEIREHKAYFEAGRVMRHVVSPDSFTDVWRVTVSAPAKMPLRYRARGPRVKPTRTKAKGRQQLSFVFRGQKRIAAWPPASDPDKAFLPVLEFSSGASWNGVATTYSKLVDERLEGFDAKKIADAVVQGATSRDDKIRKLLAYVHAQVRYTGLELGERSLVPFSPNETLGRHYGDCKDKATLLVGLLRSQKIDAHVALLDSGSGLDVPHKLPGLGLFDHAIVYVGGNQPLWIDATANKAPLGVIPGGDQDRLALVAKPGTRKLRRIGRMKSDRSLYREDVHVQFVDGDKAQVREITTANGSIGASLRSRYEGTQSALEKKFTKYVENQYRATIASARSENTGTVDKPVKLIIEAKDSERFEMPTMGDGWTQLAAAGLFSSLPKVLYADDEKEEKRKKRDKKKSDEKDARYQYFEPGDIYVKPQKYVVAYHMHLPTGFRWEGPPGDLTIEAQGIRAWRKVNSEGPSELVVEYGLQSDTRLVPKKKVREVQKALGRYDQQSGVKLHYVFGPDWRIEQGNVKEGVAEYRALLDKRKDDRQLMARYASALIGLHLGHEARAVARRMVKRWPKDANAHWIHAWVHMYDPMGRDSLPDADFAAAERSLRRAMKLDPEEQRYIASLRTIVEMRGERGDKPKGVRHEELLKLAQLQKERFDDDSLDIEIGRRLLWTGKFTKARDVLQEAPNAKGRDALWVASLSAAQGPRDALAKARELSGGEPSQLVAQAASVLALMGARKEAHELASTHGEFRGMPSSRSLQELFAHLNNHKQCVERMAPAARALHDLVFPFVLRQQGERLLSALKEKQFPSHVHLPSLKGGIRKLRSGQDSGSALLAYALACSLEWDIEEEQGAVRARLHAQGTKADKSSITFYLRKKGKRYQVVGAQDRTHAAALGRQAMHALLKKKPKQARVWLGWAREVLGASSPTEGRYSALNAVRALQPTKLDDADSKQLWRTAAVLSCWSCMGKPEEKVMRRALKAEKDPTRRFALNYGLVLALYAQHRYSDAAEVMAALVKERPKERALAKWYIQILRRAGMAEEALAQLTRYEGAFEDTREFAVPMRHSLLSSAGRYKQVQAEAVTRKRAGDAEGSELNNIAWNALFYDGDMALALELGEEAVRLQRTAAALHTLATLYVEKGDVNQAHRYLKECINKAAIGDTATWYTLGRIAAQLGLQDSARDAFGRMEKPEFVSPTGTWSLHERRKRQ